MSRTSKSTTSTNSTTSSSQKIGIYRFLQLKPQNKMVADLLIKKYKNQVKTMAEWEKEIQTLLGKNLRMGG